MVLSFKTRERFPENTGSAGFWYLPLLI